MLKKENYLDTSKQTACLMQQTCISTFDAGLFEVQNQLFNFSLDLFFFLLNYDTFNPLILHYRKCSELINMHFAATYRTKNRLSSVFVNKQRRNFMTLEVMFCLHNPQLSYTCTSTYYIGLLLDHSASKQLFRTPLMGFRLRSNYSLVQNTSILSKKIINRVFMQLNAVYYFLKVHLRASTNVSHSSIE